MMSKDVAEEEKIEPYKVGQVYTSKENRGTEYETRVECLGESEVLTQWHFKGKLLTNFGTLRPGHIGDGWVKEQFDIIE